MCLAMPVESLEVPATSTEVQLAVPPAAIAELLELRERAWTLYGNVETPDQDWQAARRSALAVVRRLVEDALGDQELLFDTIRILEATLLERPASPRTCLGRALAALSAAAARRRGGEAGVLDQAWLVQSAAAGLHGRRGVRRAARRGC